MCYTKQPKYCQIEQLNQFSTFQHATYTRMMCFYLINAKESTISTFTIQDAEEFKPRGNAKKTLYFQDQFNQFVSQLGI